MPGLRGQNLPNNLNIDKEIINNLAHLLYSNGNRLCLDFPRVVRARIDSSKDYVLRAYLSWHQIPLGMSTPRSIP